MMPYVIFVVDEGQYLQDYDPYADRSQDQPFSAGRAYFTRSLAGAAQFADGVDAMEFYRQVHPADPVRADGEPNRPLTAYTVEFRPIEIAPAR